MDFKGSPYSPLKVFHHQDHIDQLKNNQQPTPLQVMLIISDLCNQDCGFCAYRWSGYSSNQLFTVNSELASFGHNNPKRMLPYKKVVEILDDCVEMGVRAIQLTGGGEPTVHPDHTKIFQDVLDRELDLGLVTNGVNLSDEDMEVLLKAKWVRFSVDAGNAETYASVRNVGKGMWGRVWRNIQYLTSMNKDYDESDLLVGVGFVVILVHRC